MPARLPQSVHIYRPRKPQLTPFYQCVQDYWEVLEDLWEERFQKRFGFLKPHLRQIMIKYLECGDLHAGFARARCDDCGHAFLIGFSCKCRHFCPSCHQKRVIEFAQWLSAHVLKAVPHRHLVFSIPKILRRYCLFDRKRLADLSRCGWESIKLYLQESISLPDAVASAVVATQTFGEFPDSFHPHLHVLVANGVFAADGSFILAPDFHAGQIQEIFRHKVLKMLLTKGLITRERIEMMAGWRHSGFHVHCGPPVGAHDKEAMKNLAEYILRASFSQTRMEYLPESGKVIYSAKDGKERKTWEALEWLAAMISHLPLKGEHLVKYYGAYSNRARGTRAKSHTHDPVPQLIEPDITSREARKKWSYLIRKIYEVDPLLCPKCRGAMRVISFIHDGNVIRQILEHLGLWCTNVRINPRAHSPPTSPLPQYEPECQLSPSDDDLCQVPPAQWDP